MSLWPLQSRGFATLTRSIVRTFPYKHHSNVGVAVTSGARALTPVESAGAHLRHRHTSSSSQQRGGSRRKKDATSEQPSAALSETGRGVENESPLPLSNGARVAPPPPQSSRSCVSGADPAHAGTVGPLHLYMSQVESGKLSFDECQAVALSRLQMLHEELRAYKQPPIEVLDAENPLLSVYTRKHKQRAASSAEDAGSGEDAVTRLLGRWKKKGGENQSRGDEPAPSQEPPSSGHVSAAVSSGHVSAAVGTNEGAGAPRNASPAHATAKAPDGESSHDILAAIVSVVSDGRPNWNSDNDNTNNNNNNNLSSSSSGTSGGEPPTTTGSGGDGATMTAPDMAARRSRVFSSASLPAETGARKPGALPAAPKGVYLHGDVGSGKSLAMDLFFHCASVDGGAQRKRRVHFHAFMMDVHARMHRWRSVAPLAERDLYNNDPLLPLARQIASESVLICFDEMQLPDVATAAVVTRLLSHLLEYGVVLVCTSNRRPELLYAGGVRNNRFGSFADLLLARCTPVQLGSGVDYRRVAYESAVKAAMEGEHCPPQSSSCNSDGSANSEGHARAPSSASRSLVMGTPDSNPSVQPVVSHGSLDELRSDRRSVVLVPCDASALRRFDLLWAVETEGEESEPLEETLRVFGRNLSVPLATAKSRAVRFSFDELCGRPHGPADYLALARAYRTFFVCAIPAFKASDRDSARRLITLVDALYEHGCRLVCVAERAPDMLCSPVRQSAPGDIGLVDDNDDIMEREMLGELMGQHIPRENANVRKLFTGEDEIFAFRRAVSRMYEMQTAAYAQRRHASDQYAFELASDAVARESDQAPPAGARDHALQRRGLESLDRQSDAPKFGASHFFGIGEQGPRVGPWGRILEEWNRVKSTRKHKPQ